MWKSLKNLKRVFNNEENVCHIDVSGFHGGFFSKSVNRDADADLIEQVAADFLKAIQRRDALTIRKIGNNDEALDDVAVGYLISSSDPFPNNPARSASQVLQGRVLIKIVATKACDGSKRFEVIYLPISTARSFKQLSNMIKKGEATNFVNYLICSFETHNGKMNITDACGAESDSR